MEDAVMKTKSFILAMIAIAACACTKELNVPVAKVADVPAVIEASLENATKVTMTYDAGVYTSSWEVGDEMAVAQLNRPANTAGTLTDVDAINKFVGAGSPVAFNGTIKSCHDGSTYTVLVPFNALESYSTKNTEGSVALATTQTGRLSDIDNYLIRFQRSCSPETTVEGGVVTDVKFSGIVLKPLTPVIKINVPSSYNITGIRLTAKDSGDNDVVLSGSVKTKFNDAKVLNGTTTGTKYVDISRGGEIISGDVYICVFPDTPTTLVSSAAKLEFEFTNNGGAVTSFSGNISTALEAGKVKDLGTVKNLVFPSAPCDVELAYDRENDKVLVTSSTPGAVITYSASASAEPASPATAYSAGIPVSGVTYIKVKAAAAGYADTEVNAVMRVWKTYAFDAIALASKNDIATLDGCTWLNVKANANGRTVTGKADRTDIDKNVFLYTTATASNKYTLYVYTGLKAAGNYAFYKNFTVSGENVAVGGTAPEDASREFEASNGDTIGIMGTEQQIKLNTFAVLEVGTISFPS